MFPTTIITSLYNKYSNAHQKLVVINTSTAILVKESEQLLDMEKRKVNLIVSQDFVELFKFDLLVVIVIGDLIYNISTNCRFKSIL